MNTKNELASICDLNNTAVKFDNMVKDRSKDELGLFEGYDEIFNEIREEILKSKAKKILDIGCGTGNLCGGLSETLDVVGIDQSLEMLTYAKKKYNNLELKLGSFLDKPFYKNEFDIVITTYAFHNLNCSDKKKALNNMLEYLKPDGKIIIIDFMFLNDEEKEKIKNNFYNKKRQDLWKVIDSKYYTNVENLKSYVQSLGCKIQCKHIVNFTWKVEIQM
jgi:putative AdoMet-dependent methyltransferase